MQLNEHKMLHQQNERPKHQVISGAMSKVLDKSQHSFILGLKHLSKLAVIKVAQYKPRANIQVNGGQFERFPVKTRNKTCMSTLAISVHHRIRSCSQRNQSREEKKRHPGAGALAQGQSYVCRTLVLIPSTISKHRLYQFTESNDYDKENTQSEPSNMRMVSFFHLLYYY